MPRAFSSELRKDYQSGVQTIAACLKITRTDGQIVAFTTVDIPLTVDGVTYVPIASFTPTSIKLSGDTSPDSIEIDGIIASQYISETDLKAKKYSDASFELFECNYLAISHGKNILEVGNIGDITVSDGTFKFELLSLAYKQVQVTGRMTSATCTVKRFCDAQCKLHAADYTFARQIADVVSPVILRISDDTHSSGFYRYGTIKFNSGLNTGIEVEIKEHTYDGTFSEITLREEFPLDVNEADNISIMAGCSRLFTQCRTFVNLDNPSGTNIENFRGEPTLPGNDTIILRGIPPQ